MRQILASKNIKNLFHFTRTENLESILKYGLLPREFLVENDFDSTFNDEYRYDNCKNAVCTSLEFPNYKMFYQLRRENSDTDWIVLLLDAEIICDFDCAFCSENAGSASMFQTNILDRKGKDAFLKLFDEPANGATRKEMNLPDCYPTNPQAEILVFGNIPTAYIKKVYFYDKKTLNNYRGLFKDSSMYGICTQLFSYRRDYEYWR